MFLQPFAGFVLIFACVPDLAQSNLLGLEMPGFAELCQFAAGGQWSARQAL